MYLIFVVIINITFVLIIFWLVIKALKRTDLFIGVKTSTIPVNQMIVDNNEKEQLEQEDENSIYPEIINKLENHMKVNEPFMDSSLSVYDLAKQINVPSRELSIAINHNLNKHFFQ